VFSAERRGRLEGKKEGHKEGMLEGHKEGVKENMRTVARSMLARNLPLSLIAEVSGLSIEEIKVIKETSENSGA
jgi:predicted transposase YdaD